MIINKDYMAVMRRGNYYMNQEKLRQQNDAGIIVVSSIIIGAIFLCIVVAFKATIGH